MYYRLLIRNIDASKYEDESDVFYKDPEAFMISKSGMAPESRNSKGSYGDASHLLLFDILVPTLKPWLVSNGYHEVNSLERSKLCACSILARTLILSLPEC